MAMVTTMAFYSCSDHKSEKETTQTEAAHTDAFKVTKGSLTTSIKMPGELVAYQQVDLYAKVSSFVKKLYVDAGSVVKTGQLLAVLEAPELSSQLAAAQSRIHSQEAVYLSSKATYDRLLETSKTPGTISQNDLDIAFAKQKSDFAQLDAVRASYREVNNTREYLEIRAPFDGIITARNVSAGAYVGPTGKGSDQPIFTLQQQSKLRLVISVPDAYAGLLSQQTEGKFTVKSMPDHPFTAKVARLAGALDSRLRAQRVEMDVVNTDKRLLPGMVAEVTVPINGSSAAHAVPSSAVLNSTEGTFVIKVSDNKALWVPVKVGNSDSTKTEVFGDLSENDTIVLKATEELHKGQVVPGLKIKEP
jgi:membrane fusion protein (multidrug efflux system)